MSKRATAILAAAVLVALAVPAIGSAAPAMTKGGGSLVEVPAGITMKSNNLLSKTSLGPLVCGEMLLRGTLTKNTGSEFTGVSTEAGQTSDCTLGNKMVTVTDVTVMHFASTAQGKGNISLTFIEDFSNGLVCHFVTPAGGVPFTYNSGGSSIKLTEADFTSTPLVCEPGLYSGDFTVALAGGGTVVLD